MCSGLIARVRHKRLRAKTGDKSRDVAGVRGRRASVKGISKFIRSVFDFARVIQVTRVGCEDREGSSTRKLSSTSELLLGRRTESPRRQHSEQPGRTCVVEKRGGFVHGCHSRGPF